MSKIINHNIAVILLMIAAFSSISCAQSQEEKSGWDSVAGILARIVPPVFPDKDFVVTDFGAKGDGKTDCTEAFKKAIEQCSKNGGGRVVVPEGIYYTGAIHLLDNVNLHITEKAVVKFSSDKSKYLPLVYTRWEGVECMNYSALIYAFGKKNIAISGSGVLDGNGSNENWWSWKGKDEYGWTKGMVHQKAGRDKLFKMGEENVPVEQRVFGEGFYLRPNFVQFYNSKNILIQGVTFKDSPMWFLNPVLCENISMLNLKIVGLGPNNDGIDPESCKDVLIADCYFDNGDDCIAIKSGRNNDGRRVNVPSENIIVKNCTMKNGHGGVVIGSEISGGVRNVFVENCEMDSPELDRAIRIKTNSVRGGVIENLFVRNLTVGQVKEAVIKINFFYEEGDAGNFTPIVRNIVLENITSKKSPYVLWLKGYERAKIKNLVIRNSRFENAENKNIVENVEGFVEQNVSIEYTSDVKK